MAEYGKYDIIRYASGYAVTDMQTHNWMHEKLISWVKADGLARKLQKADEQKRLADAAAADAAARSAPKKTRARRK
jgi:hypothetical protein